MSRCLATLLVLSCFPLMHCSKKKEEEPIAVPPPVGAVVGEELSTGIGVARLLDAAMAPSSARWDGAIVLDSQSVVLTGQVGEETIAIATSNAGKTWRSVRAGRADWSNWSARLDGTIAVTSATLDRARVRPAGVAPSFLSLRVASANADASALSAPIEILPAASGARNRSFKLSGAAGLLSDGLAVAGVEVAPNRWSLVGATRNGPSAPQPVPLGEAVVSTSFARPPVLVTARGRDLLVRSLPDPGKPFESPQKVPGLVATPSLVDELRSAQPCEIAGWSFRLVSQTGGPYLLGFSPKKTIGFRLPPRTVKDSRIGCTETSISVETLDADGARSTATCSTDGRCVEPLKPPFRRPLPDALTQMAIVPIADKVIAVRSGREGAHWSVYVAQSLDGGKFFEVPRVVGEGDGERGQIQWGALLSVGKRVMLLISADVAGTSRRGWYAITSDDGGDSWAPP